MVVRIWGRLAWIGFFAVGEEGVVFGVPSWVEEQMGKKEILFLHYLSGLDLRKLIAHCYFWKSVGADRQDEGKDERPFVGDKGFYSASIGDLIADGLICLIQEDDINSGQIQAQGMSYFSEMIDFDLHSLHSCYYFFLRIQYKGEDDFFPALIHLLMGCMAPHCIIAVRCFGMHLHFYLLDRFREPIRKLLELSVQYCTRSHESRL